MSAPKTQPWANASLRPTTKLQNKNTACFRKGEEMTIDGDSTGPGPGNGGGYDFDSLLLFNKPQVKTQPWAQAGLRPATKKSQQQGINTAAFRKGEEMSIDGGGAGGGGPGSGDFDCLILFNKPQEKTQPWAKAGIRPATKLQHGKNTTGFDEGEEMTIDGADQSGLLLGGFTTDSLLLFNKPQIGDKDD